MKNRCVARVCLFLFVILGSSGAARAAVGEKIEPGKPLSKYLDVNYSGYEVLNYNISWTGGIKIGELHLEVLPLKEEGDEFRITARVRDYGFFRFFYPVNDTFVTDVRGPERLPFRYDVLQREGHGGAETKRHTDYNQQALRVRYRRDTESEQIFPIDGPVHNEFSSFFIMRAMKLAPGFFLRVPTFADEKRHKVKVQVMGREKIDSLLGLVTTIKVLPKMDFQGLYDKTGDTVIWFTDDECRVPVKINSKILIGSLTATLTSFTNPFCHRFTTKKQDKQ